MTTQRERLLGPLSVTMPQIGRIVYDNVPMTDRVIYWNAKRYKKQFDYSLAVKLLLEETEELFAAQNVFEKLDAVGDICFVAIGVFWKLGIPAEQIYNMFYSEDISKFTLIQANDYSNLWKERCFDIVSPDAIGAWPGFELAINSVFITAYGALLGLGMQEAFYEIIYAICNSNDTKVIPATKVASHIKANVVKGDSFVPPTEMLQIIYSAVRKQRSIQ